MYVCKYLWGEGDGENVAWLKVSVLHSQNSLHSMDPHMHIMVCIIIELMICDFTIHHNTVHTYITHKYKPQGRRNGKYLLSVQVLLLHMLTLPTTN